MFSCAIGRTSSNANSLCCSWTGSNKFFTVQGRNGPVMTFWLCFRRPFVWTGKSRGEILFSTKKKTNKQTTPWLLEVAKCITASNAIVSLLLAKFVEWFLFVVCYVSMVMKVDRELYKGFSRRGGWIGLRIGGFGKYFSPDCGFRAKF